MLPQPVLVCEYGEILNFAGYKQNLASVRVAETLTSCLTEYKIWLLIKWVGGVIMQEIKYVCPRCWHEAQVPGSCPRCGTILVASCPVCGNPVVGEQIPSVD